MFLKILIKSFSFRLKGLVTEWRTSSRHRDCLMAPCRMVFFCCFTWFLAFILISPTIFETKFDFGQFGYNDIGICNVAPGASSVEHSLTGFTFSVGFLVPCVLINISYITIFCLLKHRSNQTTILGNISKYFRHLPFYVTSACPVKFQNKERGIEFCRSRKIISLGCLLRDWQLVQY